MITKLKAVVPPFLVGLGYFAGALATTLHTFESSYKGAALGFDFICMLFLQMFMWIPYWILRGVGALVEPAL